MRVLAACILALGLAASPALANNAAPGDKDPGSAAASTSSSASAAQPASAPAPAAKAEPSSMEVATQLEQMRELLESQARQLAEQQQKMELLEEQLKAATAARESLAADPNASSSTTTAALASSAALGGADEKQGPPTSLTFKGITLTPGGFMAAETVWRSKALAADVNTPFNSAPFPAASNAHMSEFQASGRQSRISMLIEGKLDTVKIGGYYETDFLSAAATSNNNQSNSYSLRQRQFYAQAAFNNGWTFTGGQMWSLLTETTKGMDNRSEALPAVIDAQYVSGFSWARQYGFRVTKNFDNKFWLGASIEEGQATLTTHGNPTATCAPANPTLVGPVTTGLCSASALNGVRVTVPTATGTSTTVILPTVYNNFLVGAFGAGGGLYNVLGNYQYNPSPDIVVKAVWEPGFGHYEVGGLFADFRDRVFPCVVSTSANTIPACGTLATSTTTTVTDAYTALGAYNDNRAGGGIFANARWSNLLDKKVDIGVHFLGGDGIGRYGSAGFADLTTRFIPEPTGVPANIKDGTLAVIRNFQALGTLQLHPTPRWDINLYAGGEFEARTAYQKTVGGAFNEGYGGTGLSNFGCGAAAEVLPFAAQSTSASTGVPTGVAGSNGFIPGAAQNCTGDTRNLIEGTVQIWYRFYNGPKGRVQLGAQYSNFVRNTWRGVASGVGSDGRTYTVPNGAPHSDENMVFTSFRYYLP